MTTTMKLTPRLEALASGDENWEKLPDVPLAIDSGDTEPTEIQEKEEPEDTASVAQVDESDGGQSESDDDEGSLAEEGTDVEWFEDASVKALAESYGLDESELKEFSSPEEFGRFGRAFDKKLSAIAALKKVKEEKPEPQETRDEKAKAIVKGLFSDDELIDIEKLKEENYGESVIGVFAKLRKMQEWANSVGDVKTFVDQETERRKAESYDRFVQSFDHELDLLNPDAFGKAISEDGDRVVDSLTEQARESRKKVMDAYILLTNGIISTAEQQGQEVKLPPLSQLIRRSVQLAGMGTASRADALKKQSASRRPVAGRAGATKATPSSATKEKPAAKRDRYDSEDPEVTKILGDPEVRSFLKKHR